MRLTRHADYALHCLIHLAAVPAGGDSMPSIAKTTGIPRGFLAKILQSLARAGLLASNRGVRGGYRLSRDPRRISLLDALHAAGWSSAMGRCSGMPGDCPRRRTCVLRPVWLGIMADAESKLKSLSLSDLAARPKPVRSI